MTYIVVFIFAGLACIGVEVLGLALWLSCRYIFRPTPKPTQWEKDWAEIERNLSK